MPSSKLVVSPYIAIASHTLVKPARHDGLAGYLKSLEVFKTSHFQDLSPSEWLTHTPPELVMEHLNIDKATLEAIPKEAVVIVPR